MPRLGYPAGITDELIDRCIALDKTEGYDAALAEFRRAVGDDPYWSECRLGPGGAEPIDWELSCLLTGETAYQ